MADPHVNKTNIENRKYSPAQACPIGEQERWYDRVLRDACFVYKEDAESEKSQDKRDKDSSGGPRVPDTRPRQSDDTGYCACRDEHIPAEGPFGQRKHAQRQCVTHIQSTRASFSRNVPAGLCKCRHVTTRVAATAVTGRFRSGEVSAGKRRRGAHRLTK